MIRCDHCLVGIGTCVLPHDHAGKHQYTRNVWRDRARNWKLCAKTYFALVERERQGLAALRALVEAIKAPSVERCDCEICTAARAAQTLLEEASHE